MYKNNKISSLLYRSSVRSYITDKTPNILKEIKNRIPDLSKNIPKLPLPNDILMLLSDSVLDSKTKDLLSQLYNLANVLFKKGNFKMNNHFIYNVGILRIYSN